MPLGPTSLRTMWTFFLRNAVWAPLNPVAAPPGTWMASLGAELDQEPVAGDPVDVVLDDDVGLALDLELGLVVLDVIARADLHVVGGVAASPCRRGGRTLPSSCGVDDPKVAGGARLADEAERLVEVEAGDVADGRLEGPAVARGPDDGERRELDLLAVFEPLVVAGVHPEPALGVVDADQAAFGRGPVVLAEPPNRLVDRVPHALRLGLLVEDDRAAPRLDRPPAPRARTRGHSRHSPPGARRKLSRPGALS